jgi:negative regulator of flagellin synthesis FlgM
MNTTISNNALLTQLAQANTAQSSSASSTAAPASVDTGSTAGASDSVKLTDSAKALQEASRAGDSAPVDTQKVERIRQSIADGSYQANAGRIADGMISLDQQIGGSAATSNP